MERKKRKTKKSKKDNKVESHMLQQLKNNKYSSLEQVRYSKWNTLKESAETATCHFEERKTRVKEVTNSHLTE